MRVLDCLLTAYHVYLQKYGRNGLEASIYLLGIPLSFNFAVLFILSFNWLFPQILKGINIVVFMILLYGLIYLTDRLLKEIYLQRRRVLITPKHKIVYHLCGPIHFIVSTVLFFLSFKYL